MDLESWRRGGQRLPVAGHELFVRRGGDGPHVTLLHGFPTCSWDFSKVWPRLVRERSLLAVDLLGFGGSDKPRGVYSFADHCDRLEATFAALGVTRTTVVAHDYAVTLALELLARVAEGRARVAIDEVVLLNGAVRGRLHRPRMIQRLLRSPLGPVLARRMTRDRFAASFRAVFEHPPTEEELDVFWATIRERDGHLRTPALLHYIDDRRMHAARWEGALDETTVPLAFVWGERDPVSGAHVLESVRGRGRIEALPVGHYPHWEAPEQVGSLLLELTEGPG